jgi:hypothetical protein
MKKKAVYFLRRVYGENKDLGPIMYQPGVMYLIDSEEADTILASGLAWEAGVRDETKTIAKADAESCKPRGDQRSSQNRRHRRRQSADSNH